MDFRSAIVYFELVCEDYNIPPEDVMCKTSMHEAVKVKRIITYILFTFLKSSRQR